jgi:acetyl esterase/lipase
MSRAITLFPLLFLICCFTPSPMTALNAHAEPLLTFRNILDRTAHPQATHRIAYGAHKDQTGELWLPTVKPTEKLPVVILIHGGCWRADLPGPELVSFLADALRREGVAVWSITYRRIGTIDANAKNFSPYPDTFFDVAAAAEKLREIAPTYQLDLSRIVATGHSAGGHLAMWLAARNRLPADSLLYAKNPLPIHAVVGIAAMPDLAYARLASAHACGADTVDLLVDSKTRKEAAYRDTSITALIPLGVNGLKQVLISATYDAIVAPAQAHRYREQARAKGDAVTLLTLDDAGHFELIAPWTVAGKRVVERVIETITNNLNP